MRNFLQVVVQGRRIVGYDDDLKAANLAVVKAIEDGAQMTRSRCGVNVPPVGDDDEKALDGGTVVARFARSACLQVSPD